MDVELIMKAAGIAMTAAVCCQILSKIGKDDHSSLVSLAGIITIMVLLFGEIASLFDNIRGIFGI